MDGLILSSIKADSIRLKIYDLRHDVLSRIIVWSVHVRINSWGLDWNLWVCSPQRGGGDVSRLTEGGALNEEKEFR